MTFRRRLGRRSSKVYTYSCRVVFYSTIEDMVSQLPIIGKIKKLTDLATQLTDRAATPEQAMKSTARNMLEAATYG
jgi:hypothetical protein